MRNRVYGSFRLNHFSYLSALICLMAAITAQCAYAAGRRWIGNGPEGGVISSLAIDPQTPATVYAGAGAGVFKSTDGGGIWAPINSGRTGALVNALAIDPQTPATVYAGTYDGLYKSTDGGGLQPGQTGECNFLRVCPADDL